MKRRNFIQAAPVVTLALLPSFSDSLSDVHAPVSQKAFEYELRRRFEELPSFLKGDGCRMNLASAVLFLATPEPNIKLIA